MARKKISAVYCWMTQLHELKVYLASSPQGALRVGMGLDAGMDCLDYFSSFYPEANISKDRELNRPLMEAVNSALENRPLPANLSVDLAATPFQERVWRVIAKIPFGETRRYGEVARSIGKPGAARAVGQAMHQNPLPLIFP
jgi:O6-methylguanine-DNA--protein-cysteine methyltransferase